MSEMLKISYAQAIRSLMYAMTRKRPDIYYVVRLVRRHQSNLDKEHWQIIKLI